VKSHYEALFNKDKKPFDWHLSFNTVVTVIILVILFLIMVMLTNISIAVESWGEHLRTEQKARIQLTADLHNLSLALTPTPTVGEIILKISDK